MSIELHAFIPHSNLPNQSAWQNSINSLDLPIHLDPTLDLEHDNGFSPMELLGSKSGCEIDLDQSAQLLATYPDIESLMLDRDMVITFRWGGDLKECACALGAACSLVKDFNAIAYYPDDDIIYQDFQILLNDFQQCIRPA